MKPNILGILSAILALISLVLPWWTFAGSVNVSGIRPMDKSLHMYPWVATIDLPSEVPEILESQKVYLDPPTINCTAVGINNTVTVNINILDADETFAWQAGLNFNATFLNCTGFFEGEFLKNTGNTSLTKVGFINNTAGVITPYSYALLGDYKASGDGRLAYANFTVKAPGVSDIHLSDVKVVDINLDRVPVNIIDVYTAIALVIIGAFLGLVGSSTTGKRGKMLLASAGILTVLSAIIFIACLASDIEKSSIDLLTSREINTMGIAVNLSTNLSLGVWLALVAAILAFVSSTKHPMAPPMSYTRTTFLLTFFSFLFVLGVLEAEYEIVRSFVRFVCTSCVGLG